MDLAPETFLRLESRFAAPLDCVFAAWSRPEAWRHWFCVPGEGYSGKMTAFEFMPGGTWRAEMRNPNQETLVPSGVFQVITPNERLVFSQIWETAVFGDDAPYDETLVAVDFAGNADATTLTVTQVGFDSEAIRDEQRWGWEGCIEALDRYLRSKIAAAGRSY